ncbi:MAG: hypothetical protein MAG795_01092 [Candidatus Woesearchaeota archaeon]|nr:hypothetical protein [Candidatus Woesearchaeota archaeon]
MDVDYLKLLGESWYGFKKNLNLLYPVLIYLGFVFVFMIFVFFQTLTVLGIVGIGFTDDITAFFQNPIAIIFIILFGFIDVIALMCVALFSRSMLLGMLKDVAKKSKTKTKNMMKYGKKFFKTYFTFTLIRFGFVLAPLIILGGIVLVFYQFSDFVAAIFGFLFLIIYVLYLICISVFLYFSEPVIASKKGKAWELIKKTFSYTKRNLLHTVITFALVFALSFGVSIIFSMIKMPISILSSVASVSATPAFSIISSIISVIIYLIQSAVNICLGLVVSIFMFKSYYAKK